MRPIGELQISQLNSVIVITNNQENFPIIEDLIGELDRRSVEYANTMVYPLENADASDMASQLNSLFAPEGASRPADAEDAAEAFLAGRDAYLPWSYGLEITKLVMASYMSAERQRTIDLTASSVQEELETYVPLIQQGRGAEVLHIA